MTKKIRGFSVISEENRKESNIAILPKRSTLGSAGYDFSTPLEVTIPANGKTTIWTNIKSYMQSSEVLMIYVRSSIGIKKGLTLANGTGVIDSDYYDNSGNEGNIGICLVNNSEVDVVLKKEERIAQGVFLPFLISDDDDINLKRVGGIGSSSS